MIYLIPGLGADHRVFETINIRGFETTIMRWEHPEKNEPLDEYVKRLAAQVKHAAPVFIGYSFGGVAGAELTKLFPGSQLILIASVASYKELPRWIRASSKTRLNKLVSGNFMKRNHAFVRWFFSLETAHERKLFDAILHDSDPDFLYWAANALLHWEGNAKDRLYHIHGGSDRLLPSSCTSADVIIPGAGHFMIVSHGKEISEMLEMLLKKSGISPA